MAQRKCNALENFFFQNNIRFVAGLKFPALARTFVAEAVRKALSGHISGLLRVAPDTSGSVLTLGQEALIKERVCRGASCALEEALAEDVDDLKNQAGPMEVTLLLDREGMCWGLCINSNHALCDGKSIASIVEYFFGALKGSTHGEAPLQKLAVVPSDWGSTLETSWPPQNEREPPYLPLGGPVINLGDIVTLRRGDQDHRQGNTDKHITVSHSVVERVKAVLRAKRATLTGLMISCLQSAIFECLPTTSGCASVSVLVDLRPCISETNISQAFGTVSVGAVRGFNRAALIEAAAAATADLRQRVARGEAHRSARDMTSGRFSLPEATIELSNHGIYSVPKDADLLLSQRFDGYEGVSVLMHTDSGTGSLKLVTSAGDDLDGDRVQELVIERAVAAFSSVVDDVVQSGMKVHKC